MILSWVMAQLYDRIMEDAEVKCLGDWRLTLLKDITGQVLEIGCGTGINLDYYSNEVTDLILLEPDVNMRAKLQKKLAVKQSANINVEVLDCNAESIPYPND